MSYMWESFKEFIHSISDWLEAVGFIIGVVTIIKVFFLNRSLREFNNKHLFQVRIDEHLTDLRKSSKAISNLLSGSQSNLRDIKSEVSRCIEHCNSIKKKVSSNELSNLEPLIGKMKKIRDNKIDGNSRLTFFQEFFSRKPTTEKEIDEVYMKLNSLITEIEHFNKDQKRTLK